MLRLLLVPPMALCLIAGDLTRAGIIFAVAAATDAIDGWIARRWHSVTTFGRLMDPVAAGGWARVRGHADELKPGPFGKAGNAAQMVLVALILLPLPGVLKKPILLQALMIAASFLMLVSAARYVRRWIRARRETDA